MSKKMTQSRRVKNGMTRRTRTTSSPAARTIPFKTVLAGQAGKAGKAGSLSLSLSLSRSLSRSRNHRNASTAAIILVQATAGPRMMNVSLRSA